MSVNKDILPIGTIVTLQNDSNIKFMIVGYFPTNQSGEQRDYSAIRYPMGIYDNRMYFFFNSSDISNIIHRGFEDDEFIIMTELIKDNIKIIQKAGDTNGN